MGLLVSQTKYTTVEKERVMDMTRADEVAGLKRLSKRYADEGLKGPSMEWLRLLVAEEQIDRPLVALAESILRKGNEAWYLIAMHLEGMSREYVVSMGDYGRALNCLPKQSLHMMQYLDACRICFMEGNTLRCIVDLGIDERVIRCNVDNLHQADFLIQPIKTLAVIKLPGKQAVWPTCDPRKWMGAALVWQLGIAANKAVPKQPGCTVKLRMPR